MIPSAATFCPLNQKMAFSGEMQHGVWFVLGQQAFYQCSIAEVTLQKTHGAPRPQVGQVLMVAGVSKLVQIDNQVIRLSESFKH